MHKPWPELSLKDFQKTSHLLHMSLQIIGKIMLTTPFDPHWANLAMPLTSRGLTSGIIPYGEETFSIDVDFFDHQILFSSSSGKKARAALASMSVKDLYEKIQAALHSLGVTIDINQMPQEVSNPVAFSEDTSFSHYENEIVHNWWQIMLSTTRVLMKYHSHFYGISPRIGLFWGTLDLRDARYKGVHLPTDKMNLIGRNAYDDAQFEVGWSCSNEKYPKPSFFAFAYPKPEGYEKAKIEPAKAKWVEEVKEFVLDYDDLIKSQDPEAELLLFFESSYQAMAKLSGWEQSWQVKGSPR